MTTDLRNRLDDLVAEVPDHVHAESAVAWRMGARRRVRHRLVTGGAVLAVLALAGGVGLAVGPVTDPPPAHGSGETPSLSYPTRIERPLLHTGTLASNAGAIAGVVQRPDGWYAVGQHGQVWHLPGGSERGWLPALSPDGSRLAYVRGHGDSPDLVMLDLRAGTEKSTGLKPAFPTFRSPLPLHTQMFWSPDSSKLLVPVVPGPGQGEPTAEVVPVHGTARPLTNPVQGHVLPAGWYDDETFVWVAWKPGHSGLPVASATAILTNLRGRVTERIPLDMKKVWTDPPTSTSVSVPPGQESLALGTDQGPDLSVWRFHIGPAPSRPRTGTEVPPSPYGSTAGCPASWAGGTIELPASGYPDTILRTIGDEEADPSGYGSTIHADPRLHIGCSVWAADALSGTAYQDLGARIFDDSGRIHLDTTSWLSWHWRETLILGGMGVVVLSGVVLWVRRRRSRLTA